MPIEEGFSSQQGRLEELRQKLFEAAADQCARQQHGCEGGALDMDKGNDESEPLRVRVHERLVEAREAAIRVHERLVEAREAAKHYNKLAELEHLLDCNPQFARILDLLDETTD